MKPRFAPPPLQRLPSRRAQAGTAVHVLGPAEAPIRQVARPQSLSDLVARDRSGQTTGRGAGRRRGDPAA